MKVVIPGELPDLNTIIAEAKKGRGRYQPYNDMKQEHTEAVAWIAKTKIKQKMKRIDVDITWFCKNRKKDPDNIMAGQKFVLDGLVMAGVIPNDGWHQINRISHSFEVDKANPRVEVELREVGD